MCGIAGMIHFHQKPENRHEVAEHMLDTLKRRGPDQSGIYENDDATLIHARLAVVDLEHGLQPMRYVMHGEEYILVYNGELYNTEDLRRELRACGHTFQSHSDTEVLLHSFMEWKEKCVDKLNGIFAFAVYQVKAKRLFLARDRIGVKPIFYYDNGDTFLFASEIKTLLQHPDVKPYINQQSLLELVLLGPGRTPGSGVFCGVKEFVPASCGYYDENGLTQWKYWDLVDKSHSDSLEETIEKVRYLVIDSIERQLISDVPICTFLSGGLDSSIISAIANRHMKQKGEKLVTLSVDYVDNDKYFKASKFQPNSDNYYINLMNDTLQAEYIHVVIDTPQLVDALFAAVDARDLPGMADVDSSLLLFCKEVKEHATVALSGECADEIFGGYPWYRDETVRNINGFPWSQSTAFRASFLQDDILAGIDPNTFVMSRYQHTVDTTSKIEGLSPLESRMKEMVNLNFKWFMQTLLDRKDRMSMYHGLEVRVPFCDYRIAEYLYSVPWEYKDYEGREKGLLRKAMEGLLPNEVLWRKKSPYPKTHNPTYLNAVSQLLKEILNTPNEPLLDIVKKDSLEQLLLSNNPIPWYGQLMTTPQTIAYFVQMNYWLKQYHVQIR